MLGMPVGMIEDRCRQLAMRLNSAVLHAAVVPVQSVVGGGTAPNATIPSFAVSLQHAHLSAAELVEVLRRLQPPIIARISDNAVLLDLRTVFPEADEVILQSLAQL
jgi:L-seryl-tRNA(Ser) seleniumtransferase